MPKTLSRVRDYWSAGLLAVAAVVFLWIGAPSAEAAAGAGFALAGAALTKGIDVTSSRSQARAQLADRRHKDLDETRRLLYAALARPYAPGDPILAGTIVNALVHHGLGVDPNEAMNHVVAVVNGSAPGEHTEWVEAQIAALSAAADR